MVSGRERVLAAVRAAPGRSVTALARELNVDPSTAVYHLRKLERKKDVVGREVGRERVWFPEGIVCPALKEGWPLLRRARPVVDAVLAGDVTVKAIAARVGQPEAPVRARLAALAAAGFLERGAGWTYAPSADVRCCLRALDEGGRCGLWGRCSVSRNVPAAPVGSPADIRGTPEDSYGHAE